jgi:hypothetical protein
MLTLQDGVPGWRADVGVAIVQGCGFLRREGGPVVWARWQEGQRFKANFRKMLHQARRGFVLGNLDALLAP